MKQTDRVLRLLVARGPEGVSFLDFPVGFRLSGRIKDLRDAGHRIDTLRESLPGGTVAARYVLRPAMTFAPMTGEQEGLPL